MDRNRNSPWNILRLNNSLKGTEVAEKYYKLSYYTIAEKLALFIYTVYTAAKISIEHITFPPVNMFLKVRYVKNDVMCNKMEWYRGEIIELM